MERVIGIGGIAVSNEQEDTIKTFSLASCVAVTAYCRLNHTAGMIHIALPDRKLSGNEVPGQPCYYATVGVPLLLHKMCVEFGCPKDLLEIELFGGASSVHPEDLFRIGTKNMEAVEKILKESNLKYTASQTGGIYSRTLEMKVLTGRKTVFLQPLII